jgi:hypothetical protein
MAQRTPPSREQVLEMERKLGSLAIAFLIILGLWLILSPVAPEYTGYAWLKRLLGGGEGAVAQFFVGFLFLYFAGIVREKNEVRQLLRRLVSGAKASAAGEAEQARTAVELLINGLAADRPETRAAALENLRRLTAEDLGEDQGAWQRWWEENREGFRP